MYLLGYRKPGHFLRETPVNKILATTSGTQFTRNGAWCARKNLHHGADNWNTASGKHGGANSEIGQGKFKKISPDGLSYRDKPCCLSSASPCRRPFGDFPFCMAAFKLAREPCSQFRWTAVTAGVKIG